MTDKQLLSNISTRYEVLQVLGEGGMGRVYKAQDVTLARTVAVKVLTGQFAAQNVQRFQREAKAMSRLKHSNLIDVYDFGITDDGNAYLVMEYVSGVLLASILKKRKKLNVEETIGVALAIAGGMYHAHSKGIVHRDLKPSNILVTDQNNLEQLKVFDFGISKSVDDLSHLTHAGAMLGTPLYMSPEQAQGLDVDQRSDLYATGCIMYTCLTGKAPFQGDTALDTIQMHIKEPAVPLKAYSELAIPPALDEIVMRLLEKKPENRFASMDQLMDALVSVSDKPIDEHVAVVTMRKQRSAKKLMDILVPVMVAAGFLAICSIALAVSHAPVNKAPEPNVSGAVTVTKPSDDYIEHFSTLQKIKGGSYKDHPVPGAEHDYYKNTQWLPASAFSALPKDQVSQLSISRLSKLEEGAIEQIVNLPNLIDLTLNGDQYTGKTIAALNRLKNLERLQISSGRLSDSDIAGLTELQKLKILQLQKSGITDRGLKSIVQNFPQLELLDLGRTDIKGATLGELKSLPALKQVAIDHMSLTDSAVLNLQGLRNLKTLNIVGNKVSPKAVELLLKNNQKLDTLEITSCFPLTSAPEKLDALKKEFAPGRTIKFICDENRQFHTGIDRYQAEVQKKGKRTLEDMSQFLEP